MTGFRPPIDAFLNHRRPSGPARVRGVPLLALRCFDILLTESYCPARAEPAPARAAKLAIPTIHVFFISGLGNQAGLGESLEGVQRLTKPVGMRVPHQLMPRRHWHWHWHRHERDIGTLCRAVSWPA
jgi:hypothetical protein